MNTSHPSVAEAYGYGFLATVITSTCSILGIVFFAVTPKRFVEPLTGFLSSVAVGALSGDAILHLIPTALGLHDHGEENTNDGHTHSDPKLILTTVLIGVYIFFLVDIAIDNLVQKVHSKSHKRDNTVCDIDVAEESTLVLTDKLDIHQSCECDRHEHQEINVCKNSKGIRHICRKTIVCFKEISAYAWCLLLADAIHNFADGIALGAAFSQNISSGITMSLAVLFHELPHELGDYAILIRSGLTPKRALLMNIATGMTSFIGFFIGVSISTNQQDVTKWILAFTAGIFLYVSLTSILPDVSTSRRACRPLQQITIYVGGMTIGMVLMALLAFFEERLHSMLHNKTNTILAP